MGDACLHCLRRTHEKVKRGTGEGLGEGDRCRRVGGDRVEVIGVGHSIVGA